METNIIEGNKLLNDFIGNNENINYHNDLNSIILIIDKICSGLTVRIYGSHRDINGEDVDIIIHNFTNRKHYSTLKIEYGRRFIEFNECCDNVIDLPITAFMMVVKFVKWYNQHKIN